MIGQTISHYRVLEKLGAGGMGVVYLAEDLKLQRTVALKFLPSELTRDTEAKARFVNEARAASALDHPNICTIYEVDETDDGQMFIAMAYYEGETLKELIARGPRPLSETIAISRQIAQGLAKAHEQGIVHRDVKPANIVVTAEGLVKVLDFGLAKLADQTRLTRIGSTLGTVAYLAPEQARGEEVDRRADIWALGACLYEMVTGRRPFLGDHAQAVLHSVLNTEPEPLTALRAGVPLEFERIARKTMAKRPEDRYQHLDDLLVDLRALARHLGEEREQVEIGQTRPKAGVAPRWWMRKSWSIIALVLAAVLVVSAFLIALNIGHIRDRLGGRADASTIRSLAVLPFDNMTGNAEQDFFVEGVHEALITELSKLGSLRVISRTSAMLFARTDKPIPEIARDLNVDALVEGSVLRVGDRVRITAQLIRGDTDEHLWAEDYDRNLKDILALLTEVAQAIAGEIHGTLSPRRANLLAATRPVDPAAYEAFLKGMHYINQFTEADILKSREFYRQSLAIDPTFAPAHVGLGMSYLVAHIVGNAPSRDVMPYAREAVLKALELDPDLAAAHTGLGFVYLYFDWDWESAIQEFRHALELNPNDATAYHGIADYLTVMGHADEAVDQVERGRQCDPLSPLTNMTYIAHLYLARRYEEAIAECQSWRQVSGNPTAASWVARGAYLQLARYDRIMDEYRKSLAKHYPDLMAALESEYSRNGILGALRTYAEYFVQKSDSEYVNPLNIARYFAYAGEAEQALVWLEKAFTNRVSVLVHMLADPGLDPLRSDPRFQDLMKRIGIPRSAASNKS